MNALQQIVIVFLRINILKPVLF